MFGMKWLVCLLFLVGCGTSSVDVVIPCVPKDLQTLERCIEGIKRNGSGVRRVIVVSPEKLSENAEWFDETRFPFGVKEVGGGWNFQQLVKLYAPFVIPDISDNVLVLDADAIFMQPTAFMNRKGEGYLTPADEYEPAYFRLMDELVGLKKQIKGVSGIAHHMLMQKPLVERLFGEIRERHGKEPWKAVVEHLDEGKKLSEYELYFNYALKHRAAHLRPLKWTNSRYVNRVDQERNEGYDFVAYHTWARYPHALVFIHDGETVPQHLHEALEQARLFHNNSEIKHSEIILLARKKALREVKEHDITKIDLGEIEETDRLAQLHALMEKYRLTNVACLSCDHLVYIDFRDEFPKLEKVAGGIAKLGELGSLYVKEAKCLEPYLEKGDLSRVLSLSGAWCNGAPDLWEKDEEGRSIPFIVNELGERVRVNVLPTASR